MLSRFRRNVLPPLSVPEWADCTSVRATLSRKLRQQLPFTQWQCRRIETVSNANDLLNKSKYESDLPNKTLSTLWFNISKLLTVCFEFSRFVMWEVILFRWTPLFCRNMNGWVKHDHDTVGYETVQEMWSVRSMDKKCKSFSLLLWIWLATWLVTCTYVVSQLCYSFPVGSPNFREEKAESWTIKHVLTLFAATLIYDVESSSKIR